MAGTMHFPRLVGLKQGNCGRGLKAGRSLRCSGQTGIENLAPTLLGALALVQMMWLDKWECPRSQKQEMALWGRACHGDNIARPQKPVDLILRAILLERQPFSALSWPG